MKSFCGKCKTYTNQDVLHESEKHDAEEDGWWETRQYQIIQCAGCETISFRQIYTDIQMESAWSPEDGDGRPMSIDLFPNNSIHHLPINSFSHTPLNIRAIYKETMESYNNNQLILCSGGLRAIIEGICSNKKVLGINKVIKGKTVFVSNLETKIEGLAEQGFLTTGNATILHNLRFIGNDALHELAAPTKSELKLAIKIIEHTIESLYELDYKAKRLASHRAIRKPKP